MKNIQVVEANRAILWGKNTSFSCSLHRIYRNQVGNGMKDGFVMHVDVSSVS